MGISLSSFKSLFSVKRLFCADCNELILTCRASDVMMKSYEGNRDFPLKALWSGWPKTGTLITVLINMSECGVLLGFASFTSARGL